MKYKYKYWEIVLGCVFVLFAISCSYEAPAETAESKSVETDNQLITNPRIKLLTDRINQDTTNAELYFARANAYLETKELQGASFDILQAMKNDSSQAKYYLTASDILIQTGNGTAAVKILQNGLERLPENTTIWLERAKLHYYLKQYEEAILSFNKLIKLNPSMPEVYFYRGLMRKERDELDKATKDFETAIEHNPDYYDAMMQLGIIYGDKDQKLALGYLDNALRLDPQSSEALYAKALIYQNTNMVNKAKETYKKLLSFNKQNANSYYNLGIIYLNQDSLEMALKHFDLSVLVEPTYYRGYYMKGVYWEKKKDVEKAKAEFKNALSINPAHKQSQEALNRLK